jgi:hypothetical protein
MRFGLPEVGSMLIDEFGKTVRTRRLGTHLGRPCSCRCPRSSQDLAPSASRPSFQNEQVSVVANGDSRLFGSLVTGHVVSKLDVRALKDVVKTGRTLVGRGVERREPVRAIPLRHCVSLL